jgi:hypothetical protein
LRGPKHTIATRIDRPGRAGRQWASLAGGFLKSGFLTEVLNGCVHREFLFMLASFFASFGGSLPPFPLRKIGDLHAAHTNDGGKGARRQHFAVEAGLHHGSMHPPRRK